MMGKKKHVQTGGFATVQDCRRQQKDHAIFSLQKRFEKEGFPPLYGCGYHESIIDFNIE